jgi:acid phosphatase (class A)
MGVKANMRIAVILVLSLAASAGVRAQEKLPPEMRLNMVAGYLKSEELPDSAALLPPPPALGSATEALDQQIARDALGMRDGDRYKLATEDADLSFPNAAETFACTLGVAITEADTPTLYRLLHRLEADAGRATSAAKKKYQHARPFMMDGQATCHTPKEEEVLRSSGSYPSGHTSIGWAWAEVLAEIAPDRADAILQRGRAFGESRIICNAHWSSDVEEGRTVGSATVAKLHANDEFRADLEAAKAELTAVRAKGLPPQRDCAFEAQTLKATPWLTR